MIENWKLREVIVLSVLAVVFGVVYLLFYRWEMFWSGYSV